MPWRIPEVAQNVGARDVTRWDLGYPWSEGPWALQREACGAWGGEAEGCRERWEGEPWSGTLQEIVWGSFGKYPR